MAYSIEELRALDLTQPASTCEFCSASCQGRVCEDLGCQQALQARIERNRSLQQQDLQIRMGQARQALIQPLPLSQVSQVRRKSRWRQLMENLSNPEAVPT